MYHVFLGAPSAKTLLENPQDDLNYTWTTVSSSPFKKSSPFPSFSSLPPPATLEAASRRISLLYQNAIFQDDDEQEASMEDPQEDAGAVDSTLITWPPTPADGIDEDNSKRITSRIDGSRSFLNTSTRLLESQETQESQSLNYSDSSSITRFPNFHFNLHSLTSLAAIRSSGRNLPGKKLNVLLAVLEVEGPDTIRTKKGPDAGKEISILKMILGDEEGSVCKLTAWRETADVWGGSGPRDIAAKRGDVVLLENVTATYDPSTSPTLTASPNLKSKLEICYRTMPYAHEDMRFRPDLRLGSSDASVRKVAAVVRWFERMAGLSAG